MATSLDDQAGVKAFVEKRHPNSSEAELSLKATTPGL